LRGIQGPEVTSFPFTLDQKVSWCDALKTKEERPIQETPAEIQWDHPSRKGGNANTKKGKFLDTLARALKKKKGEDRGLKEKMNEIQEIAGERSFISTEIDEVSLGRGGSSEASEVKIKSQGKATWGVRRIQKRLKDDRE